MLSSGQFLGAEGWVGWRGRGGSGLAACSGGGRWLRAEVLFVVLLALPMETGLVQAPSSLPAPRGHHGAKQRCCVPRAVPMPPWPGLGGPHRHVPCNRGDSATTAGPCCHHSLVLLPPMPGWPHHGHRSHSVPTKPPMSLEDYGQPVPTTTTLPLPPRPPAPRLSPPQPLCPHRVPLATTAALSPPRVPPATCHRIPPRSARPLCPHGHRGARRTPCPPRGRRAGRGCPGRGGGAAPAPADPPRERAVPGRPRPR